MNKRAIRLFLLTAILSLGLSACADKIKTEASYPERYDGSDKIVYSDKRNERDTIWGEGETLSSRLFGDKEDDNGAGIGVNSFLWRAALDTVSFMPLNSADPFGGVILTEWYENPEVPGERFKLNIYILDRQLRADGVRVAVFKQTQGKGGWRDAKVSPDMGENIENSILTRARELRVAQLGNVQ